MRASGEKQRCEVANCDEEKHRDNERSIAMADNSELLPNPQMLFQNQSNIQFLSKSVGEILQSEDLQMASQSKQNTQQKEDRNPVNPRPKLHQTAKHIGGDPIPKKRDRLPRPMAGRVPPDPVRGLDEETGQDEEGEDPERSIELGHVATEDEITLADEFIKEEESTEAVAAHECGKAEVGNGRDGGEGELDDGVVGAPGGVGGGEEGVGGDGDDDAEDDENGPGDGGAEGIGLVDAHPAEA